MATLRNLLLFAGCATFSLYIFPVGGVQPAHVLLAMAAFVAMLGDRIRFSNEAAILLALAAISFGREALAVLSGAPTGVMIQPVFILFNLIVLVGIQTAYLQTPSVDVFKWGAVVATMIALGSLVVMGVDLTGTRAEARAIGTFQNPNQLAYFSAIVFSTAALLYSFGRISGQITALLVVSVIMLAMAAQSKSGLVGLSLGVIALLSSRKSGLVVASVGCAALLCLHAAGALDFGEFRMVQRLSDIGSDPDDSFAARGYLLLVEAATNPLHVWFGLGAHGVRMVNDGHEIHSTYAAYFGLYGLAGGLLYLAFLGAWMWHLLRALPLTAFTAVVAPPLLFGIAHNGTRFSIFYALISLSLALCEERRLSFRAGGKGSLSDWVLAPGLGRSGRVLWAARTPSRDHFG